MNVTFPVTIGDTQFISSTLTEADYPAFSAGTTYTAGERVIYAHAVYEALEGPGGANVGQTPSTIGDGSSDWWTRVGPTNRWAMFDTSYSTKSVSPTNTLTVVVRPGTYVTTMHLLNAHATQAVVTGRNGLAGPVVFGPVTVDLDETIITNYWEYSFSPYRWATQKQIDGLPMYTDLHLTIELTHDSDTVCWLGGLVIGSTHYIGEIKRDSEEIGAQTFTGVERNPFGTVSITPRDSAKEMQNTLQIAIADVDRVYALMIDLFSTPAVWYEPNDSMRTLFGIQTAFKMKPQDQLYWTCDVSYEGFT